MTCDFLAKLLIVGTLIIFIATWAQLILIFYPNQMRLARILKRERPHRLIQLRSITNFGTLWASLRYPFSEVDDDLPDVSILKKKIGTSLRTAVYGWAFAITFFIFGFFSIYFFCKE